MLTNMFTILQGIPEHVNQNVYNLTGDPSTCLQSYRGSQYMLTNMFTILQGIPVHVNEHVYNLTGDPSTC